MLTLREVAHIGSGTDLRNWDKVYQYEVVGLPRGEEAWIAEFNHRWKILRSTNGITGNWSGDYETSEVALKALSETVHE
jgi:hypothetical protein